MEKGFAEVTELAWTETGRAGKVAKGSAAEGDFTDCQTTVEGRSELRG